MALTDADHSAGLVRHLALPAKAAFAAPGVRILRLVIAGTAFELSGPAGDSNLARLFDNFAPLATSTCMSQPSSAASLKPFACIEVTCAGGTYRLFVNGLLHTAEVSAAELIYEVEGILVPSIQLARPDLLFVHAACLARKGRGCLLLGPSGAGKSTLCWALCQRGFAYLSDEMAPLEVAGDRFLAHAYPHALCLKQVPPAPFDQSSCAFSGGRTWHLPMRNLARAPVLLSHIFHVSHRHDGEPQIATMALASAAQCLYTQVLNALAHPGKGLPTSVALASSVHNASVISEDLETTCKLVLQYFDTATAEH